MQHLSKEFEYHHVTALMAGKLAFLKKAVLIDPVEAWCCCCLNLNGDGIWYTLDTIV